MAGEEDKPALNEAQIEAVRSIVNGSINGAVATLKKSWETKAKADAESLSKMLDEKFAAFKPAAPEPETTGKEGKGAKPDKGEETRNATLSTKMRELEERVATSEKARLQERSDRRKLLGWQQVSETFRKNGGDATKEALFRPYAESNGLFHEMDPDGEDVVMVGKDPAAGADIELDAAMKSFLKSDLGKHFMPPTGAAGTGMRRAVGAGAARGPKEVTYDDVGNFVLSQMGIPIGVSDRR